MDAQDALPPTNVLKADHNDLAGAQSIGGNQKKHRVVAQARRRCPVYGLQKCADRFPR